MPRIRWRALSAAFVAAIAVIGCTDSNPPLQPAPAAQKPDNEEHAHKPGAHGGIIVSIGKDNYHAEAMFERGGQLRLYTLAKDESTLLEVEANPLTAFVKAEGDMEATSFVLRPEPQPGDQKGMTTQFIGKLPVEYAGKRLEVTIPTLKIGAERFRVGFKNTADEHVEGMPAKVAAENEKELYLTPGGAYTDADIKANGNRTASQKFKGLKAAHDLKPKPGDKICPITLTKANTKFTWIVGGKEYEFCCPPCVDEFVAEAKQKKPEEIKPPEEFIKK